MFSAAQPIRAVIRLSLLALTLHSLPASAGFARLAFRPIDAGYSRSLDKVIFVASSPNQVHIYDAVAQSDRTVNLASAPLNMSLSSDGTHVAVAHSNSVVYVNLQTATIEQTFANIAVGTGKVVVGTGYVYVVPSYSGSPISINLSTAQATTTTSFFIDTGGIFDSAINAIYYTQDGLSSNSVNRFSTAGGAITTSTSQPFAYFSAFSVCGPLALSLDGGTIYSSCGAVYRASNDSTKDMRYLGLVPGMSTGSQGLAVSDTTLNQIAVIPKVQQYQTSTLLDDTVVKVFNSSSFNALGQFATTPFLVNSISSAAHGRWVFYNSSSSAMILVTQADPSAALTQDYAVETFDLGSPNSCNALFGGTSTQAAASGGYATTPILSGSQCIFTAVSNVPWISLASGFSGSGNTTLTYLIRPNLAGSPRSGTISLGGQVFTVNQDAQSGTSDLTALSFKPVAADYDKPLDKIVMVSASPNELHVFDPVTHVDQIVSLTSIPLSVSVRPDGLAAAVGNRGSVSLVDLQQLTVMRTIPVDMDNVGIVLASNGYAYAFPTGGSLGTINSVQLSSGTLTGLQNSSYGEIPRLDPSGTFIYTGGTGWSKFEISNGPAVRVVPSTFLSQYGNLWLSENGARLVGANGNSFLTSTVGDLTANGHFSGTNVVAWATNSQSLSQTAVLTDVVTGSNTQLQLYGDDGLQLQNQIALPGFTNAGKSYVSHGRYIFWNAAASKLFALIQADSTSGLMSDYALYSVNAPQSLSACSYSVSPLSLTVPSSSTNTWFFDVTSNCTWSPILTNPSNSWFYLSTFGYTTGNARVTLYASGSSTTTRSSAFTVGTQTVMVTQAPSTCAFSISPTLRSFTQAGGTGEVNLTTGNGCPWSIQSSLSWLSVAGSQSGTGPAVIRYTVDPNTTSSTFRSAALNIAGNSFNVQQTTVPVSGALNFVPTTPCRLADTRGPQGLAGGPFLAKNGTRTIYVTSSNCNIPTTAIAYSLNITVVPHGTLDYLTAWPEGQAQPFVSTLNSRDGRTKANAAIIGAGSSGAVRFYATDDTELIVDITGYFVNATSGNGLTFFPLTPCRVFDSRNANGPLGGPALTGGQSRNLPVLQSSCGLTTYAQAYSFNFTAVPASDSLQYLTTWPSGQTRPLASTLNSPTGSVVANAAILQGGSAADVSVYTTENSHVVIDTNGYFAPPASGTGLHYYSVAPCRVLDTRESGDSQPFQGTRSVAIGGNCSVPSNASAVVLNSTVLPSQTLSYLTIWAYGQSQPLASTLNASDGAVTSNMAITPMASGQIDVFATDSTHLVLDVTGYFAP